MEDTKNARHSRYNQTGGTDDLTETAAISIGLHVYGSDGTPALIGKVDTIPYPFYPLETMSN